MPEPSAASQSGARPVTAPAIGDPLCVPASFARFIVPFAYRLDRKAGPLSAATTRFVEAGADDWLHGANAGKLDRRILFDLARRRYLTHETAEVLFSRARWFVLHDPSAESARVWKSVKLARHDGSGEYRVVFRPPALVLFETDQQCASPDDHDILQTGLLVLEAFYPKPEDNEKGPDLADILAFHEAFRHTRRPFFGHEDPLIKRLDQQWKVSEPNRSEPAGDPDEYRRYHGRWTELLALPVETNCDDGGRTLASLGFPARTKDAIHPAWAVDADGRAHVCACVLVEENSAADPPLAPIREFGRGLKAPAQLGYWRRLLNVDKLPDDPRDLHENTEFERDWTESRTYLRWAHYGTAQGFTGHSTMMLGAPCGEPPTWLHFGQMYFDQLLLMLYVRASIFRFSRRLSSISAEARKARGGDAPDFTQFREDFARLRLDFDLFTNLYRFPLLSTEQQAVEMFEKLNAALDIEAIYKEVENEVDGTHDVLELLATQRFSRVAMVLSVLGVLGVLAGLIQAVLSFTGLEQIKGTNWIAIVLTVAGVAVLFVFGFLLAAAKWPRKIEDMLTQFLEPRTKPRKHHRP